MMQLRPYQEAAVQAVQAQWQEGNRRTLLVLPTGCGKTIVFCRIAEDEVRQGRRVLILAHREELLSQAAEKLEKVTGLGCAREKAEETCLSSWYRITVGSVQTLQRDKRLARFAPDFFDSIIIDEAHHALADGYRRVVDHFADARVLGVTATPDRGDRRDLGQVFDSLAYEYTLPQAIREGYLCPIKALTVPLKLDITGVGTQNGDYKASDLGTALDPYLDQIADTIAEQCAQRKTVIFLPLVKTAQKMRDMLCAHGLRAAEVNGESADRAQVLAAFERGDVDVLCNAMLLTEGWDCPSVDCVVVLRPTKQRGLYCLDEKTEVLTREGWKNDVEIGEDVLAFDYKTGETKFVPTMAKIRRPLDKGERFYHLEGQSSDIRVTDRHRMLYDNKRRKGWKFKETSELAALKDGAYIPVCGHGKFDGVPLSDAELTFIGWVMTDGCINDANGQITITQGEQQLAYCKEIEECIKECGFKFTRSSRRRTPDETHFNAHGDLATWTISKGKPRGRDKHLSGWGRLEPWLSKDMSRRLFDMTEKQFEVMLEAIYHGDGNKHHTASWHIGKGNKTFIERLQMMAIQRGYRASVSVDECNEVRKCKLWMIHLKKQDFVKVGAHHGVHAVWEIEEHSDESCWCVQNELGTLVTRRNGKVAIVGNCQMVGRGTRLSPETGKTHLLLLDFLWLHERHQLCRPAHLLAKSQEIADAMTRRMEEAAPDPMQTQMDLLELEDAAQSDVVAQREEALAKALAEMRHRKRALVDPLQFELSIQAEDLSGYIPSFKWECEPPSGDQLKALERAGIFPDEVESAGKAAKLLDKITLRRRAGLTTPKQIRFLEGRGFQHVGTWSFADANRLITRISANGWRIPQGVVPETYAPAQPVQGAAGAKEV